MKILIVNVSIIPVNFYGGTERVIWGLGKELVKLGHEVTFLVNKKSYCNFASVIHIDKKKQIIEQIRNYYDVVHFHFMPNDLNKLHLPYLITKHDNTNDLNELDQNTVFVSRNHAARYNSNSFVYNGIDWGEYAPPNLKNERSYFHFLGKAAWRVKNVVGAIQVIKTSKSEKLKVLGGVRFNFKMGMRFTFSPRVRFMGMVGGESKYQLINGSKGLIFPVRWHEPFGLAIIESLYYGCPVFGTTYGSLPELVKDDVGFLSNKSYEIARAIEDVGRYSRHRCHEYALNEFNVGRMTDEYVKKYKEVISGQKLNPNRPRLLVQQENKFLDWE